MDGQVDGATSFSSFFSFGFRLRHRQHGNGAHGAHGKGSSGFHNSGGGSNKPTRKVLCRYGMGCTHVTDPVHRERFWHPSKPQATSPNPEAIVTAGAQTTSAGSCSSADDAATATKNLRWSCHECGLPFKRLEELQLHLKRKTAWSNKSLVGCRISCLVDNREWHEGIVLEYAPMTGKHRVCLEHLAETRWMHMLRVAFFIVQRPVPGPSASRSSETGEVKEAEKDVTTSIVKGLEGTHALAPVEPWTYAEDVTLEYARAQAILHDIYGGKIQETGHKTQGHLCVTEADKAVAKDAKSSLLYGELLVRGINKAMQSQRLGAGEASVVYELGMGIGKVAMQVFLQFPNLTRVYGVELSVARFNMAVLAAQKLVSAYPDEFVVEKLVPDRVIHVRSKLTGSLLDMEVGNLLDTPGIDTADIVLLETDLSSTIYHDLCRLLRHMKPGARAFTYLDMRKIWSVGPFPFRQLDINRPISDRYATSWSVNRGHHFFLWVKMSHLGHSGEAAGSEEPLSGLMDQPEVLMGGKMEPYESSPIRSYGQYSHMRHRNGCGRRSCRHCAAVDSPPRGAFTAFTRAIRRLWRSEPGVSPSPSHSHNSRTASNGQYNGPPHFYDAPGESVGKGEYSPDTGLAVPVESVSAAAEQADDGDVQNVRHTEGMLDVATQR